MQENSKKLGGQTVSPPVTIVLVNYYGHRDTVECLETLLRLEDGGANIIVVDNSNSLESADAILRWSRGEPALAGAPQVWNHITGHRKWPTTMELSSLQDKDYAMAPRLRLVRPGSNIGFAGANNLGATIALRDPACQYVWFLNNDTAVRPDALLHLLERMRQAPNIGMCGATLVAYDQPEVVQACGARFNAVLGRGVHLGNGLPLSEMPSLEFVEARMNYVVGAAMLVSRSFFETVGPMEESYFLYFEELDWARRAAGKFTLGWAPASIVYHKEGASIGTSYKGRASDTATYYQAVNLLRFNRRFMPLALPLSLIRIAMLSLRFRLRKDRGGAKLMLLALRDFIAGTQRRGPIDLGRLIRARH